MSPNYHLAFIPAWHAETGRIEIQANYSSYKEGDL
jgi:hypothetical protein